MRMFNADGSEAEMCGNGVRCVAKYVYDHAIAQKPTLKIETGRGVLSIDLEIAAGKAQRARVDMGEPILEAAKISVELEGIATDERVVDYSLDKALMQAFSDDKLKKELYFPLGGGGLVVKHPSFPPHCSRESWTEKSGLDRCFTCVSMGNPHIVLYCREVAEIPLQFAGRTLEEASIFHKRINVHFVEVHSRHEVTMRTWERGSGITLACGTGASAVCVAGVLAGKTDRKILAHLPGGDLELEWRESDNHVYMTGPATEVFTGDWTE
jgi:diaminopimelate epimerase